MRDGAVQKRLLGKADLTFAKALEVAELEEMAARDVAQLHEGQPKDVNHMSGPPRRGRNRDALGHLPGHAIAVGEATYQTNASSGGSTVGFASYKVMPRGCAERR